MFDLDKIRLDTPGCSQSIHFNNAGSSLPPAQVTDVMIEYLQQEAIIGGYEMATESQSQIKSFYENVGALLNTSAKHIAFTYSATQAFVKAISSIPFERGDVILTTVNDYVSNQLTFLSLKKRFGIELVYGKEMPEGGVDVRDMELKIIAYHPKLVCVTHVPTNSGLVQDIEAIGQFCRKRNIWYLVDACQSAGQIDLDMSKIGCDFLSATFRKFMRGPRGAGFLAVSDRVITENIAPLFIDLTAARWTGYDEYRIAHTAVRFEEFEKNYALVVGSSEAVKYLLEIGIDKVQQRTYRLSKMLRTGLDLLPNLKILDSGKELAGIVTFTSSSVPRRKWIQTLKEYHIHFSVIGKQNAWIDYDRKDVAWAIRLSPHYYNTESEVDKVIEVLGEAI